MGGPDGIRAFLSGQWGPAIPIGVAVIILLLRNRRPRRLKVERMWLIPAIYTVLLAVMFWYQPPPMTLVAIGTIVLALLIGGGIGWQRARFTRLDINPETHEMTAQASIWGVAFILLLMLGRRYLQGAVIGGDLGGSGLTITTATDALAAFAVATMVVQRLEIWFRASKMLEEARTAKLPEPPSAETPPSAPPPIVQ